MHRGVQNLEVKQRVLHFSSLNMMLSVSVTPDFRTIFSQLLDHHKALLWYQFVGASFTEAAASTVRLNERNGTLYHTIRTYPYPDP